MGRLKEKGRTFREAFLAKLGLLLRGTVAAPPERYGETLADEHIRGGGFLSCTSWCRMQSHHSLIPHAAGHAKADTSYVKEPASVSRTL